MVQSPDFAPPESSPSANAHGPAQCSVSQLYSCFLGCRGCTKFELSLLFASRLDVIRTEKLLRATGLPNNLAAVKDALAAIPAGTETVPIDARLVPAVVGKSGANFRRVEEEYSVAIDVDRSEGNSAIVIRGLHDQAAGKNEG